MPLRRISRSFEVYPAAVCPPRRRAAGARWPKMPRAAFLAAGVAGAATRSAGLAHDETLGDREGRRVRTASSLARIPYVLCLLLACCLVEIILLLLVSCLLMLQTWPLIQHMDVICCYIVICTYLMYDTKVRLIMQGP